MIGDNDKGQTRSEWWLSKIYPLVLSGGGSAFYGTVTTATSTTQFKVDSLKGLGTNLLNDAYYCQVIEADAAAPEGEIQKVSAYTTSDGDITVGTAFTVAPAVGDYVLILHESVAKMFLIADGAGDYPASVVNDSILGHMLAKLGVVANFNDTTDSLEAISDKVGAFTGDGGILQASSDKASMDLAHTDLDAILADIGDASASTLTSLYAILGNPSASLATTLLDGIDARVNNANLNALLGVVDAAGYSINGNIGNFQAQTNLQTLLAALGIPDVAAKSLYTCLVTDRLDNVTFGLSALNTDLDTIITDTEKIYDVALGVAPVSGSLASFIATGGTALGTRLATSKSILDALGHDGTTDLDSGIMGQLQDYVTDDAASIYGRLGAFTGPVAGTAQDDNVKASLDLLHTKTSTGVGVTQVFEKSITSAANATNVTVGTITTNPCLIKSIVVHADTAAQADLTSAGVFGGVAAAHTVTFLSAVEAAKANIDAVDEQVSWTGAVRLAAGKVIEIDLQGTGATAVDLTVIIEYMATVAGGYLA